MSRWVCLDIGETLVDETRVWSTWAAVLGVPAFTLHALIGAAIAAGGDHVDALRRLDVDPERHAAEVGRRYGGFRADDLYPDALPALEALRRSGARTAVIGNQPASRTAELRALGVRPDVMAMSDELGVAKPDPAFFARVLELCTAAAGDVAYVGDRVDNDVAPAAAAGLRAVWLRRGPWGLWPASAPGAALVVGSLTELAERLDEAFA